MADSDTIPLTDLPMHSSAWLNAAHGDYLITRVPAGFLYNWTASGTSSSPTFVAISPSSGTARVTPIAEDNTAKNRKKRASKPSTKTML